MSRFLSLPLAKMPYLCSPLGKSSRFEVRGSRFEVEEFESWRFESWRLLKEEESIRFRKRLKIGFGSS